MRINKIAATHGEHDIMFFSFSSVSFFFWRGVGDKTMDSHHHLLLYNIRIKQQERDTQEYSTMERNYVQRFHKFFMYNMRARPLHMTTRTWTSGKEQEKRERETEVSIGCASRRERGRERRAEESEKVIDTWLSSNNSKKMAVFIYFFRHHY